VEGIPDDVLSEQKEVVAETLCNLADRHRVCINMIWALTDVCTFPRKDFAGALRRIQRFLNNYNPEELRKDVIRQPRGKASRRKVCR
jgi:hypothetical protein